MRGVLGKRQVCEHSDAAYANEFMHSHQIASGTSMFFRHSVIQAIIDAAVICFEPSRMRHIVPSCTAVMQDICSLLQTRFSEFVMVGLLAIFVIRQNSTMAPPSRENDDEDCVPHNGAHQPAPPEENG